MKKRMLSLLVAVVMAVTMLPTTAFAAVGGEFTVGGIKYCVLTEFSGIGTVEVIANSYSGYSGDITVPNTVENGSIPYMVTSIGDRAFMDCSGLTNIIIPGSVTFIGGYAFEGCSSLTSINIPDGVTSIGTYAFYGCSSLTSINIPDGVTFIPNSVFSGCSGLTNIIIPDRVTSIGDYALAGCSSLTSVSIPGSVTSIGYAAFRRCRGLTSISIPSGVTSIRDCAFDGCSSLTSISIPNGVTSIRDYAFDGCSSLTSISIPDGVTFIGTYAFRGCSSLTSIIFHGNIPPSFGNDVFNNIPSALQLTVPLGAKSRYMTALNGKLPNNSTIEEPVIDVANAAQTAAEGAAYPDMTQATATSETVISDTLKARAVAAVNNSDVTVTINKVSYTAPTAGTLAVPRGTNGSYVFTVTVSKGLESRNTTQKTIAIIATAIVPDEFTVNGIKYHVLTENAGADTVDVLANGCNGDITIPKTVDNAGITYTVTSIRANAFFECKGLTSVCIPGSVTFIGAHAFYACSRLTNITFSSSTPPSFSSDVFDGVRPGLQLFVPRGTKSSYETALAGKLPSGVTVVELDIDIVNTAKAAAEGASYSDMTQAEAINEAVIWFALRATAVAAVNNPGVTVAINKVSYTVATAGSISDPSGTNGSYVFTVTVSQGSQNQITTAQKTITITATAFAVTDVQAVAAAKTAIVDGTVHVAFAATQADKTAAVQSYVNHIISNTANATGVTGTVTHSSGNQYSVTLSKGSATDSKSIDMVVNEASVLTGTATISNINPKIGDVLTGSLDGGNNTGTLAYIWKADGTQAGTGISYTVAVADLGKTITLEIASSVETGAVTSIATAAVAKKTTPSAPTAPALSLKNHNSVTLTANAAYEFSKGGITWQTSNAFSGLTASTAYTFYQRVAETADTEASAASTKLDVTTDAAPAATLESIAITTPAAKLEYTVGEALDITGMAVTGTYSDSSTKVETITAANVTGFDSSTPATGQVLIVTVGGKTTTYTVTIKAAPVVSATISPTSVSYDLASPSDASTNITWNSASTVTDVVYGGTSLTSPTDYVVSGSVLTIKDSYLSAQGFTAGSTADFTISFDEGNPATLTISIVNNHTPGSNADLIDLTIGGSTVSGFLAAETSYNVELPYGTSPGSAAATIGATADDLNAGVSITQASSLPGSATVEVTAENGTTKKTYTINFTLKSAPPVQSDEKNVTSVITPTGAAITDTNISATVENSITSQVISLSVSAMANWKLYSDAGCTSEITNKTMTLSEGPNTVYVRVTAEDGGIKDYTLTITRQGSTPSVSVTGILMNKTKLSLYSNTTPKTETLVATVSPGNAANKAVSWVSSNSTVATVDANGKVTAMGNGTATITATTADGGFTASCTVTVTTYTSGDGTSGDGGYVPAPPASNVVTEKQPYMPTTAKTSVTDIVKDGILSATITEQMVKDAIKVAQDAAKKSGKEVDGIALNFKVTGSGSYTSLNAAIDAGAIDRLKEAGVKFVKIGSAVLDITLDAGAIAEIDRQTTGTVTISATKLTKLSDAAKKFIGNRPVFDIKVSYQKNGKTETVSNFGKGAVTLGIAYKATVKESKGNLLGIYVDKDGKPQLLTNSSYDNGRLIFSRNSLSTYGVGYKAPAPEFTDTAKHWAKDNIDFVASRDLISGTSATTFAPNIAITRADFLMALGRLSGANMSIYKTSSFTDVKASDTTMPYIEWAVGCKIVSGYGNGKFGPTDLITREQMAVMMQNYAKATGYKLPISIATVTFSDNAKISAYAKDAVKAIQQAGIMQGKGSNTFDPQGNATRGEASTILRRFIELVIDEGTARGWSQNDAGQWQYIGENGKAVTGWLTDGNAKYYFLSNGIMVSVKWLEIDGKWYYFYADGALAKNTKIDGYEVDENGVRKTK